MERTDIAALVDAPNADLVRAALLFEREDRPGFDPQPALDTIARWARLIDERLGGARAPQALSEHIADLLFSELGFRGNRTQYDDPDNSYLSRVLERRTGIPISLSLLYLGIGRELCAPILPIGFPGHFLVQVGPDLLIDPFGEGRVLGPTSLHALVRDVLGPQAQFRSEMVQPLTPRATLARMQRNLKNIFMRTNDAQRALGVCDRLVFLLPDVAAERRDRGLVYEQLECFGLARRDFEAYLSVATAAEDAPAIREHLVHVSQREATLH